MNGQNSEHKIIMIGDSFLRGCAKNVKTYINDRYEVFGTVKPGAKIMTLTNSAINDTCKLTSKDLIILCGGTNDIASKSASAILKPIVDFIKMNNHTNILISSIPYRHDLASHSQLNKEITIINRKLLRITQAYDHTEMLIIDNNRNLYTRHGLHLNKVGKLILVSQIVRSSCVVLKQKITLHIVMNWKLVSDNSVSTGNVSIQGNQNKQLPSSSDELPINRMSNRVKKLPVTRSEDFLW